MVRSVVPFIVALDVVACAVAVRARAACEDARLAEGVAVRRCEEDGRRWAVLRADLAAADVAVRVARSGERGQSTPSWRASVPGAVAAVQGGSFHFPAYEPLGLTIGEGEPWPGSADDGALAVLVLDANGAGFVAPAETAVAPQRWMHSAVSGWPVLRAGAVVDRCEGDGCEPMPRTAAGLSADGRDLVLVVVEGWTAASEGVSDPELGALALQAGAYDAIRIGEGATSVLDTAGGVGAIASSDGAARPAAAHLAIVDRGSGASGDLVGVVQRASDRTALPEARIRVETTDGRTVAEAGTLTSGAYFRFTLAERTYIVRATHAGYREGCRVCSVQRAMETWCSLFLEPGSGAAECSAPPRGLDAGELPLFDAGPLDARPLDARPPRTPPRSVAGGCGVGGRGQTWVGVAIAVAAALAVRRRWA